MGRDRKSTHRNNHKQAWKQGLRELEIIVELTSVDFRTRSIRKIGPERCLLQRRRILTSIKTNEYFSHISTLHSILITAYEGHLRLGSNIHSQSSSASWQEQGSFTGVSDPTICLLTSDGSPDTSVSLQPSPTNLPSFSLRFCGHYTLNSLDKSRFLPIHDTLTPPFTQRGAIFPAVVQLTDRSTRLERLRSACRN
jgi:hypothetical protein